MNATELLFRLKQEMDLNHRDLYDTTSIEDNIRNEIAHMISTALATIADEVGVKEDDVDLS